MIPFEKSSYLAQVFRLRALAVEALKNYPLAVISVDFINHGENATFKVTARRERRAARSIPEHFLLRLHRSDYHTLGALREELDWLKALESSAIEAPRPVLSRSRDFIAVVTTPAAGERYGDLFDWISGRFVYKNMQPSHLEQFGETLAGLQLHAKKRKVKHRRYWTADGLVGESPKFGSVHRLQVARKKDQALISSATRTLFKEFSSFAKTSPDRMGLIHADLHFGNALFREDGRLSPIDFDDCGLGFYAYDLCVPLLSALHIKTLKPKLHFGECRAALLNGYTKKKTWTEKDDEMLTLFMIARRIIMLGWLSSRSSNPKLKARLPAAIERAVTDIRAARL